MNILILSWRGPGHPNAGGAEISTHEHAKRWVTAGHNVILFTSHYRNAKKEEIIDDIKIIRAGHQNFGVHLEACKWYCFKPHPQFDLVVDQFHGIPFFTPLYVRVKKLGFIHEVTKEVWRLNQFPSLFYFIVSNVGTILEPLIFKLYKNIHFMTVSESTKKDLVGWDIPDYNITVIHNGIKIPLFERYLHKEMKKTLIFLGALAKDKGIEDALYIFSILGTVSKDWRFWVVGKSDPQYLKELKLQSDKLQLKGRIKFWGYVNEHKKFELLERAHILINPSVREGWGLVVIEAATVGTPTVAFNVPGLRDSIKDQETGILTKRNTNENLAFEIIRLLKDRERYERIRENAISWSKKFSWDKAGYESLKLIEDLVGKT